MVLLFRSQDGCLRRRGNEVLSLRNSFSRLEVGVIVGLRDEDGDLLLGILAGMDRVLELRLLDLLLLLIRPESLNCLGTPGAQAFLVSVSVFLFC